MVGDTKLTNSDNVKSLMKFTLLESVGEKGSAEDLASMEEKWRNRLQCWAPVGSNVRDDGPTRLRRKR